MIWWLHDLKEKGVLNNENDVIKILNIKLFQMYEKMFFINISFIENLCRFFNFIK